MIVSPSTIRMSQDGDADAAVKFYNPGINVDRCRLDISYKRWEKCANEDSTCPFGTIANGTASGVVTFVYDDQTSVKIVPGKTKGWKILIKNPTVQDVDCYTATLACESGATYAKDFVINTD